MAILAKILTVIFLFVIELLKWESLAINFWINVRRETKYFSAGF